MEADRHSRTPKEAAAVVNAYIGATGQRASQFLVQLSLVRQLVLLLPLACTLALCTLFQDNYAVGTHWQLVTCICLFVNCIGLDLCLDLL